MFPWGVLDTVIYLTTRVIAERHGRGILAARTRVRVTVTVTRAAAELNATPQQVANAELALLDAGLLAGLTLAELREVLATELVEG
mgnify:FL=1